MTREQKIEKRKERAKRRIAKRKAKDQSYLRTAQSNNKTSISWGRRRQQGRAFSCEMNWSSCEERGYCSGDC